MNDKNDFLESLKNHGTKSQTVPAAFLKIMKNKETIVRTYVALLMSQEHWLTKYWRQPFLLYIHKYECKRVIKEVIIIQVMVNYKS